jgi:single-stranded-DNA-specific exonuclease
LNEAFLGVTRSALGRAFAERLDERGAREAARIAEVLGLSHALARVIAARGATLETAERFLTPRLRDELPDPSTVQDMDKAVARLAQAVGARETVAIFGDYDVDGACSAALLGGYLQHFGLAPLIHIPDRLTEGYGPNSEAIRALHAKGASLLVCVDCGTSGHGPLGEARALGLDVIVLDHHQAPETLPDVLALVNPNRLDDLSELGHLCAAGVVFLALAGINRALRELWTKSDSASEASPAALNQIQNVKSLPDLMSTLDIVALASVADVVPLTGLNRAYVAQGLKVMGQRLRPGLVALGDVSRLAAAPEAWHLGYLLGPRINAGGRIGDASLGARLLMTQDADEARDIAARLDTLNRERQAVEEAMLAEAEEEALRLAGLSEEDHAVLVVSGERWHPGIVGIIAGRIKERFGRPAFAIAGAGDVATGSGRSIAGVDLGAAVRAAVEAGIVTKGGGHAMAAGITLEPQAIPAFADFLEARLAPAVAAARASAALLIDAVLTAESLTPAFLEELARAAPFGQGNPEPVFLLPAHRIVDLRELNGGHLKLTLASGSGARVEAMAFRAAGKPLGEALQRGRGGPLHVAGTASLDSWGGRPKVTLKVQDVATPQ